MVGDNYEDSCGSLYLCSMESWWCEVSWKDVKAGSLKRNEERQGSAPLPPPESS